MLLSGFDIIGDIHGHADALLRLLKKCGYTNKNGIYSHPNRKVVFLGDFIDKGSQQTQVINIVKNMVDNNNALAIMGNHEFNAICYHTINTKTGLPLREHSERTQTQHQAFLNEYPIGKKITDELIQWFKTLPLFLDKEEFRAVHACWDINSIEVINTYLNKKIINDEFFIQACQRKTAEFKAVETLLKGLELKLPDNNTFLDQYGYKRDTIRIKWWANKAKTYQDYALVHNDAIKNISTDTLSETISYSEYLDQKSVFFGHYCFIGKPKILKENAVCLDYSVANHEKLVCYHWNTGDKKLSNKQFAIVNA